MKAITPATTLGELEQILRSNDLMCTCVLERDHAFGVVLTDSRCRTGSGRGATISEALALGLVDYALNVAETTEVAS